MMSSRKVLVVLDDVDHLDQLEALAGEPNWFKLGSRVIITTRDKQVLVAHGVPKNLILDVKLLSHKEANCLFYKYAFGKVIPNQVYEQLSERVAHYADGLPLTIKVLGSLLRGRKEPEWIDALKRLETIPLTETLEKLELSYQSLEYDQKEIFLDVACILKGWEKEEAIMALESCGFHPRIGLSVLEQKCLITVSPTGCLGMHDHIEEMGKHIVRRLHPYEPHKHSRLWVEEETEKILVEEKGTEETRCIIKVRWVDPIIVMKGLRKMKELRFLDVKCYCKVVDYKDIGEDSMYLPNGLQYLSWDGYPFRRLPNNFKANNLVGLKLHYSDTYQLWEGGDKVPEKLRFIDLHYCKLGTLDIERLENLERLNLVKRENLEELNMGTAKKPNLKHLTLRYTKLKALNLRKTEYLESLNLECCGDLAELHMPVEFSKLKSLNLCRSKLRALDIGHAQNLHTLNFFSNNDLVELHLPVKTLKHLRLSTKKDSLPNLALRKHHRSEQRDDLLELHMPTESPKLKIIYLCSEMKNPNLTTTKNHGKLGFVQCEDFLELQNPIESRDRIIYIRCQMSDLNLMLTCNLDSLDLLQCNYLQELHMPIEFPELKIIKIRCFKLKTLNLTGAWNLEKLEVVCKNLQQLRMPIVSPKLKRIFIPGSKLRTLNLTGAGNLEMVDLLECQNLLELHLPVESLKHLRLACSTLKTLNLTGAGNLEICDLLKCQDLLELHLPVESLKHLGLACSTWKTLNLTGAGNLERLDLEGHDLLELHDLPFENLKHLQLTCSKLRTLNLTRARNLERLDLVGYDLLELRDLPIENLKHPQLTCSKLRTLYLTGAGKLKTFNIHFFKLEIIELELTPYLEHLDLNDCLNLREVYAHIGCGCVRFKPLLVDQGFPMIGSSAELHLIVRPIGMCPLHIDNSSPKFHFEYNYKEPLPLLSRNLEKLISFSHCACTNLAGLSGSICGLQSLRKLTLEGSITEVPKELDQLECLEELTLLKTDIEHLPDSICTLKNLKFLQVESCRFLKQLPEDLGRLQCLEELHIKDSKSLLNIPNSICEMTRLKCFHLIRCIRVMKLPRDIGSLPCLEDTWIEGTGIIDPPESLFQLKGQMLFFPRWS